MRQMKPQVESFEQVAISGNDLDRQLHELDQEVIRLRGTVQGVLMEIIELKVPRTSLGLDKVLEDAGSSQDGEKVGLFPFLCFAYAVQNSCLYQAVKSIADELQAAGTNMGDRSVSISLHMLIITYNAPNRPHF